MNAEDRRHLALAKAKIEHIRRQQGIDSSEPVLKPPTSALERVRLAAETAHHRTPKTPPPSAPPPCPTCRDLRFVRRDLQPTHPEFGKSIPCPTCHTTWMEATRAGEMAPRWHLTDEERTLARKSFGRRAEYPIVEQAAHALSRFVANALAGTPKHYYFTLDGTPGTGKTHLCLRAALKASEVPVSVIYTTGTALSEKLHDFGYKDSDASRRDADERRRLVISDLTTARLLVLDEIDHITGDWTNDYLLEVLNRRRSRNLCTLLAGNNIYLIGRDSDRRRTTRNGEEVRLNAAPVVSRLRGREGIWIDFTLVSDARGVTFATTKEPAS